MSTTSLRAGVRAAWCLPLVLLLAASGAPPAHARDASSAADRARPHSPGLVLDESAYCRAYYQFGWDRIDPKALRERGEEILGRRGMSRLEQEVKRLLAYRNIDWSREDWRDHAVTRYVTISHSLEDSADRLRAGTAPRPPPGWLQAGFDDGQWARLRKPFAVGPNAGMHFSLWSMASPGLQAVCLRFRFEVPDPARAGELTLSADYVGGLRAWVNGAEVARGHLPPGEIGPETISEGYGEEAYCMLLSKLDEKERQKAVAKSRSGQGAGKYYGFADWHMPPGARIYAARNRHTGPVRIPASLLRRGENVLAIEIRAAPLNPLVVHEHAWIHGYGQSRAWLHAMLSRLDLRSSGPGVPTGLERPPGVQVWAEDVHRRVFSPEYLEPGASRGTLRMVGARNGTYAAQVVVGTDRPLAGVRVTPGDLRAPGGQVIPASAVAVCGMAGHPAANIIELGGARIPSSEGFYTGEGRCFPEALAKERFAPKTGDEEAREQAWQAVSYFDHVTRDVPREVAADACRPYWLSLRIPRDAAPGEYTGTVTVSAEGEAPVALAVEVEVVDWSLPDPADLQALTAVEQSPYAVAKQYEVPLWSDEHFRKFEKSVEQLARIGNDWWFVPVILHTEFGNRDDSMIRWTRRGDGELAFDFRVLDRYLDLIVKHCGEPRVVSFVVMHGAPAAVEVNVLDEATGNVEPLRLGGEGHDPEVRRAVWRTFAAALYRHMKARGLDRAMHWGYAWDTEGDPLLKPLLRSCVPEMHWTYVPRGARTPLSQAHAAILVSHRAMNRFRHQIDREAAFGRTWSFWHGDKIAKIGTKTYDTALWVIPYHETVYNLEGSGYKAFSAEVGVNATVAEHGESFAAGHEQIRVCFEIHVDGKPVAHSGLMKSTDEPRLLVADGLETAGQMKLVTRLHTTLYGDGTYRGEFAYCNWAEPALHK